MHSHAERCAWLEDELAADFIKKGSRKKTPGYSKVMMAGITDVLLLKHGFAAAGAGAAAPLVATPAKKPPPSKQQHKAAATPACRRVAAGGEAHEVIVVSD